MAMHDTILVQLFEYVTYKESLDRIACVNPRLNALVCSTYAWSVQQHCHVTLRPHKGYEFITQCLHQDASNALAWYLFTQTRCTPFLKSTRIASMAIRRHATECIKMIYKATNLRLLKNEPLITIYAKDPAEMYLDRLIDTMDTLETVGMVNVQCRLRIYHTAHAMCLYNGYLPGVAHTWRLLRKHEQVGIDDTVKMLDIAIARKDATLFRWILASARPHMGENFNLIDIEDGMLVARVYETLDRDMVSCMVTRCTNVNRNEWLRMDLLDTFVDIPALSTIHNIWNSIECLEWLFAHLDVDDVDVFRMGGSREDYADDEDDLFEIVCESGSTLHLAYLRRHFELDRRWLVRTGHEDVLIDMLQNNSTHYAIIGRLLRHYSFEQASRVFFRTILYIMLDIDTDNYVFELIEEHIQFPIEATKPVADLLHGAITRGSLSHVRWIVNKAMCARADVPWDIYAYMCSLERHDHLAYLAKHFSLTRRDGEMILSAIANAYTERHTQHRAACIVYAVFPDISRESRNLFNL